MYAIADVGVLGADRVVSGVVAMADAGVDWIQLRAKSIDDRTLYRLAADAARELDGSAVDLWINDRADVAAMLPCAGVHLGQDDLPPAAAREILRPGQWIGRSTHTETQLDRAAADPAVDVIAVGPVFTTVSKADPAPEVGVGFVRWARRRTDRPIVAIGGIDAGNLGEVLAAGADAVAVVGAACRGDVGENGRRLVAAAGARRPRPTAVEGS